MVSMLKNRDLASELYMTKEQIFGLLPGVANGIKDVLTGEMDEKVLQSVGGLKVEMKDYLAAELDRRAEAKMDASAQVFQKKLQLLEEKIGAAAVRLEQRSAENATLLEKQNELFGRQYADKAEMMRQGLQLEFDRKLEDTLSNKRLVKHVKNEVTKMLDAEVSRQTQLEETFKNKTLSLEQDYAAKALALNEQVKDVVAEIKKLAEEQEQNRLKQVDAIDASYLKQLEQMTSQFQVQLAERDQKIVELEKSHAQQIQVLRDTLVGELALMKEAFSRPQPVPVVNVVNQVPEQAAPRVVVNNQVPEQTPAPINVIVPPRGPVKKTFDYHPDGRPATIMEEELPPKSQ